MARKRRWANARPSSLMWSVILALVTALGFALVLLAPQRGYNSRIYAAIGQYFGRTGTLPAEDVLIGPDQIAGSYADFPALNLWLYRLMLGSEETRELLWTLYQLLPVLAVGILLTYHGKRLSLSDGVSRTMSLVALILAIYVSIPGDDKTYFWWLPVLSFLALSVSTRLGALLLGMLGGWTGLAPLSAALPAVESGRRWASRVGLLAAAAGAGGLAFFAAGPLSLTLLANRTQRESAESFWYSIWQLTGPLDQAWARSLFVLVVTLGALVAYLRGAMRLPSAFTVMGAATLLASNSTVPSRIVMFLPLGVFVFRGSRKQVLWLAGVLIWLIPVALGQVSSMGLPTEGLGDLPLTTVALSAIFVNVPLIAILVVWLATLRGMKSGTQTPREDQVSAPHSAHSR